MTSPSAPAASIGHNGGPAMDDGVAWRRHCWSVARAELLPHLPLEVIRLRVRRAKEIGLDYRTYALARETSGRDIIAFLYSSNALGILRPGDALPDDRARRLRAARNCARALPPGAVVGQDVARTDQAQRVRGVEEGDDVAPRGLARHGVGAVVEAELLRPPHPEPDHLERQVRQQLLARHRPAVPPPGDAGVHRRAAVVADPRGSVHGRAHAVAYSVSRAT